MASQLVLTTNNHKPTVKGLLKPRENTTGAQFADVEQSGSDAADTQKNNNKPKSDVKSTNNDNFKVGQDPEPQKQQSNLNTNEFQARNASKHVKFRSTTPKSSIPLKRTPTGFNYNGPRGQTEQGWFDKDSEFYKDYLQWLYGEPADSVAMHDKKNSEPSKWRSVIKLLFLLCLVAAVVYLFTNIYVSLSNFLNDSDSDNGTNATNGSGSNTGSNGSTEKSLPYLAASAVNYKNTGYAYLQFNAIQNAGSAPQVHVVQSSNFLTQAQLAFLPSSTLSQTFLDEQNLTLGDTNQYFGRLFLKIEGTGEGSQGARSQQIDFVLPPNLSLAGRWEVWYMFEQYEDNEANTQSAIHYIHKSTTGVSTQTTVFVSFST